MPVRILSLALGNFAVATGAYVVAGMLADVASHTGVAVSAAGQLVTVYALTYGVAAPVLSALFGHSDRRRLLAAALVLSAVGNVLTALAPGFATLAAARVLAAVGAALYAPAAIVMAADLAPLHRRGSAVALVVTGSTLATVLGVPAGVMLAGPLGHQGVYAGIGLLCVGALATLRALPRSGGVPRVPLRTGFGALKGVLVPAVLAVSLLASVSDFAAYTFAVPLLSHVGDPAPQTVSVLLVVYGVAGSLGNTGAGWVTDRIGALWAMLIALTLLGAGLVALPLVGGSVMLTGAALALWGLGGWGILPAVQAKLLDAAPEAAGSVVAFNVSVVWLGMGLGGIVGGGVIEAAGMSALAVAAGLVAVAALAPLAVAARAVRTAARGGADGAARQAPADGHAVSAGR
ncbi:MFS transporter [Streptomonospora halophila]|uniref:MFS transporter n=1 Tax=Streptomonospora halophila TaxID=427369 RepID=A0ABP9G643_9ACTN